MTSPSKTPVILSEGSMDFGDIGNVQRFFALLRMTLFLNEYQNDNVRKNITNV
jgi:hypothetical protein